MNKRKTTEVSFLANGVRIKLSKNSSVIYETFGFPTRVGIGKYEVSIRNVDTGEVEWVPHLKRVYVVED